MEFASPSPICIILVNFLTMQCFPNTTGLVFHLKVCMGLLRAYTSLDMHAHLCVVEHVFGIRQSFSELLCPCNFSHNAKFSKHPQTYDSFCKNARARLRCTPCWTCMYTCVWWSLCLGFDSPSPSCFVLVTFLTTQSLPNIPRLMIHFERMRELAYGVHLAGQACTPVCGGACVRDLTVLLRVALWKYLQGQRNTFQ